MGVIASGSGARVAHAVAPDDREPGVPPERQPAEHVVDLAFADVTLSLQYGLTDAWGIEVLFPLGLIHTGAEFFGADGARLEGFESIHHRDETIFGVGDPELSARWAALSDPLTLELRAGLTLPFGRVEPDPYALGRVGKRHTHQFLGAGTLVPVAGVDLGWTWDEAWALSGWFSARAPLYESAEGYRASTVLEGGVHLVWRAEAWTVEVGPGLRGERAAEWSGRAAENSGRTDLIAALGARYRLSDAIDLLARAQIPIILEAAGSQVTQPVIGTLGVRYTIDRRP